MLISEQHEVMGRGYVLLVPPDTRPYTLDLPLQVARIAGLDVKVPPKEALPFLNQPGDTAILQDWLWEHASKAQLLLVSLDTLTLGGLIPSRRVDDALDKALSRLKILQSLKTVTPNIRIYAHGTIMRVAHGDDPWEEKPYYSQWGAALRRYSEWADRASRCNDSTTTAELSRARQVLPPEVLKDYLTTRKRNHAILMAALQLAAEGVLDRLHLTLDDTSAYGLAAMERRALEARIDELNLWDRVDVYPGCDELPCTLLARYLLDQNGRKLRVYLQYPSFMAESVSTIYEDRPLGELIKAHMRAAGMIQVPTPETAELIVAVNTPAAAQAEAAFQPDFERVETPLRNLPEFLDRIAMHVEQGHPVVVLDVAYANGADDRFLRLMLAKLDPTELAAYAGWNTAGNTLGSGLALGAASLFAADPLPCYEAILTRLADDWFYQALVRQEVRKALRHPNPYDLGSLKTKAEAEVALRLEPLIHDLWTRHFASRLPGIRMDLGRISLPWPRLFSVRIPLKLVKEGG